MKTSRGMRERTSFGRRMYESRKARKLTQVQVRDAIGISQSTLADLESVALTSGWTAQLAALYEVDALWLATGAGPRPNWKNSQHQVAGEEGAPYKVAHQVSHFRIEHAHSLEWETLMKAEPLPRYFWVQLPDDSMAPRAPKGKLVCFETGAQARPGDGVLVRDAAGSVCFRVFVAGSSQRWTAKALNPAYEDLDSQRDDLSVIAVLKAEEGRWA